MRTLTRLILALLLLGAGAIALGSAPATAATYGDMTLTPNSGCPGEYCMITFDTPVYYSEHGSIDGSLVNADTGVAETGLSMPYQTGAQVTLLHALPAGRYILTIHQSIRGHWSCSIYNPDACSWRDPLDQTLIWKFVYSGTGTLTVPRWSQAAADGVWVKGKLSWKGSNFRVKGRVLARAEQADFTMGPWRGGGKRTVLIQVRRNGPWKTIHKGKAKASGKFNLRFKFKDKRVQRWQIVVPAENGMPAGSKRFSGWR